jgi:chromosome segregation ATPase
MLREQEASAWAAVRERAEAVDEKFRQLEIDIAIAENRLASELADDATSFAEAVEAELHDWDAAIERLQTRAATKAQNAREQAEAEIAELRQARNRPAERLTALPASSDAWQEQKNHVTEALDDLERKVREAALKLH